MNKILIVSSDKNFVSGIKSDSHSWDFIIQATDANKDLPDYIGRYAPDLLVIDFILNESNGGAICHQLKSNPETQHLPVILLSEYSGIFRFTTKFGCDMLLQKPVDNYKLFNVITNLLNPSYLAHA